MCNRSSIAIAALVLVTAFASQSSIVADDGGAQRTVTQVTPVPGPADSQALLKRIAELEKRVKELEDDQTLDYKNEQEDDAKDARLEQRLAALERAPRVEAAASGRSGGATSSTVTTRVQAPFEVVARDGRSIVRIVEWGDRDLAGGVYVFNQAGGDPVAIVGPLKDEPGGRVAVFQVDGTGSSLTAASQGATLSLRTPGSKSSILLQAAGQIDLFNKGGTSAFSVTARTAGNGRWTLGDAAGNTVVEAGSTTDGIGIVRAGPRLVAPTTNALTIPTSIVGKK
jgi:hypothetical protein